MSVCLFVSSSSGVPLLVRSRGFRSSSLSFPVTGLASALVTSSENCLAPIETIHTRDASIQFSRSDSGSAHFVLASNHCTRDRANLVTDCLQFNTGAAALDDETNSQRARNKLKSAMIATAPIIEANEKNARLIIAEDKLKLFDDLIASMSRDCASNYVAIVRIVDNEYFVVHCSAAWSRLDSRDLRCIGASLVASASAISKDSPIFPRYSRIGVAHLNGRTAFRLVARKIADGYFATVICGPKPDEKEVQQILARIVEEQSQFVAVNAQPVLICPTSPACSFMARIGDSWIVRESSCTDAARSMASVVAFDRCCKNLPNSWLVTKSACILKLATTRNSQTIELIVDVARTDASDTEEFRGVCESLAQTIVDQLFSLTISW